MFFFNDTATTEIYTLSLHGALPISAPAVRRGPHVPADLQRGRRGAAGADARRERRRGRRDAGRLRRAHPTRGPGDRRSEEHTSELQSRQYLVCRLLLEKKYK